MADTATAPAPAPAAADKKKQIEKPEKPNADLFNEQLAKAEKEYQEAFAKYVRSTTMTICDCLELPQTTKPHLWELHTDLYWQCRTL